MIKFKRESELKMVSYKIVFFWGGLFSSLILSSYNSNYLKKNKCMRELVVWPSVLSNDDIYVIKRYRIRVLGKR